MNRLKQLLAIDLRTLAIFRIALGTMLLVDLATRAVDLRAHYTDFGILPRDFWLSPEAGRLSGWEFSLHLANGSVWYQALLFMLAGLFACMLLFGYRTRLAGVGSWLLLLSLQHRNLYVLQGSDTLLLLMLFWGMFLPLGAWWSVDAALTKDTCTVQNPYLSVMGVGLLLQVVCVYFFTALFKDSADWWPDGIAAFYVTHYAHYLSPTGEALGRLIEQHHIISYVLSYYVWFLEFGTPFLLFFPIFNTFFRLATLFLLASMHVGFWIFMEIGLFPPVSLTSLLVFFPATAWLWIEKRIWTKERAGLRLYYDTDCDFCLKTCRLLRTLMLSDRTPIAPARAQPRIQALLEQKNSWVVVDHDGSLHVKWDAMIALCRRSFLFHPLAPVLAAAPIRRMGNRLYDRVAARRPVLSRWSATWFAWRRPLRTDEPFLVSLLGIAFIALLLFSNVESLQPHPMRYSELIDPLRRALIFRQEWNMFSPSPIGQSVWLVVEGELEDGTTVDVLSRKDTVNWARPDNIADWHQNYRWRKYLHLVSARGYEWYTWHWGLYLCRDWNEREKEERRLTTLTIYWMLETLHPGWDGTRSIDKYQGQTITCA